jgi:PGF-CTERM protein
MVRDPDACRDRNENTGSIGDSDRNRDICAAEPAKKSASGFTAVFVIAGMLAAAYAVMRRRE